MIKAENELREKIADELEKIAAHIRNEDRPYLTGLSFQDLSETVRGEKFGQYGISGIDHKGDSFEVVLPVEPWGGAK